MQTPFTKTIDDGIPIESKAYDIAAHEGFRRTVGEIITGDRLEKAPPTPGLSKALKVRDSADEAAARAAERVAEEMRLAIEWENLLVKRDAVKRALDLCRQSEVLVQAEIRDRSAAVRRLFGSALNTPQVLFNVAQALASAERALKEFLPSVEQYTLDLKTIEAEILRFAKEHNIK